MLSFKKYDAYGQELIPGDVCVRSVNDKVELIVYKGASKGGNQSKGTFGRFLTSKGTRSIKFSSVVSVFDPMGTRRSKPPEIDVLVRQYYESIR